MAQKKIRRVNKRNRSRREGTGYSLIELLVVVLIVSVLASTAIPRYTKMVEKSRMRDAESKLAIIYQAQRMYRLDFGGFSTRGTLITAYMPEPNTAEFQYTITPAGGPLFTSYTATATRQPANAGKYNGGTISLVAITSTSALTYTYDTAIYLNNGNPS